MTRYPADLVGLSAPAHAAHAAPEHHVEDVHGRAEAAAAAPAAALLDGLLPTLVIYLPLLSVGQNLVSLQHNTESDTFVLHMFSSVDSVYLRTCEISLNLSPASGFLSG